MSVAQEMKSKQFAETVVGISDMHGINIREHLNDGTFDFGSWWEAIVPTMSPKEKEAALELLDGSTASIAEPMRATVLKNIPKGVLVHD